MSQYYFIRLFGRNFSRDGIQFHMPTFSGETPRVIKSAEFSIFIFNRSHSYGLKSQG